MCAQALHRRREQEVGEKEQHCYSMISTERRVICTGKGTVLFVLFKLYEEIEEIWGCIQLCLAPGE